MKILLFLIFFNLNLGVDFKDYSLKINDFEEIKFYESSMRCKSIEDKLGRDCVTTIVFKVKENINIEDSYLYFTTDFDNLHMCFRKYGLTKKEKQKSEFKTNLQFSEFPYGGEIEVNVDYLKFDENNKTFEKGEKKYLDFCKPND